MLSYMFRVRYDERPDCSAPQGWSTGNVSPAVSDALGIGGPALTLKSSGKLDLATMAQA